jgi:hypothetical protein
MTTILFDRATWDLVFNVIIFGIVARTRRVPRIRYARVLPGFRNIARAAATVTALPVTGDRRRRDYKTPHARHF